MIDLAIGGEIVLANFTDSGIGIAVPGNHEYMTSGAAGYFEYFSDTPSYYAYTLGV